MEFVLECVIDIGEMIISAEGLRKPEKYISGKSESILVHKNKAVKIDMTK